MNVCTIENDHYGKERTMWDGRPETIEKKRDVTRDVVGAFGSMKGRRLGMIMADTCTCLEEFARTGKVDETTRIVDFNYLKGVGKSEFMKSQRSRVAEICRTHGIGKPCIQNVFKDVLGMSLNMAFDRDWFDSMYLDTCSQFSKSSIYWLNSGATCDVVKTGGIVAITWSLSRTNTGWLDEVDAPFDSTGILLRGDSYSSAGIRKRNVEKLCRLRKAVEDGGRWKAVRLIHYNRKHDGRGGGYQMATCIFRKIK